MLWDVVLKLEGQSYKLRINPEPTRLLIEPWIYSFLAFTGFETNNKYKVLNSLGQQIYFAAEGTVI